MRRHLTVWLTAWPTAVVATVALLLAGLVLLALAGADHLGVPVITVALVLLVPLPLAVPALAGWWR